MILFHGCGGVRIHIRQYAQAATRAGWAALIIDSFEPRGWSRRLAQFLVCTGLIFRGRRRAGDVLAALCGARAFPIVDPTRIAVAGWSHGAWAIMDLWAQPLVRRGEVRIADADRGSLDGVLGAFLAYPYVGFASASRDGRAWPRAKGLKMLSVVPRRDHLASVRRHMRALASAVSAGAELSIWSVDATHAFDEPGLKGGVLAYDEALSLQALDRFTAFLASL
ncbi:dienelactone hydrolase [Rhizobium sp. CRIBSB]|nr:dienelactone hydrolase [Rhizobium sp. CRIBSB]